MGARNAAHCSTKQSLMLGCTLHIVNCNVDTASSGLSVQSCLLPIETQSMPDVRPIF